MQPTSLHSINHHERAIRVERQCVWNVVSAVNKPGLLFVAVAKCLGRMRLREEGICFSSQHKIIVRHPKEVKAGTWCSQSPPAHGQEQRERNIHAHLLFHLLLPYIVRTQSQGMMLPTVGLVFTMLINTRKIFHRHADRPAWPLDNPSLILPIIPTKAPYSSERAVVNCHVMCRLSLENTMGWLYVEKET